MATASVLDRNYSGGQWELRENDDGSCEMEWTPGRTEAQVAKDNEGPPLPALDTDSLAPDSFSLVFSVFTDKPPWAKELKSKGETLYHMLSMTRVHVVVFRHRKNGELGRVGEVMYRAPPPPPRPTAAALAEDGPPPPDYSWCTPFLRLLDKCNTIVSWNSELTYNLLRAHGVVKHQRMVYWLMKTIDAFDTLRHAKFAFMGLGSLLTLNNVEVTLLSYPYDGNTPAMQDVVDSYLCTQNEALLQLHYVIYQRPDHHLVYTVPRSSNTAKLSTHLWQFPTAREAAIEDHADNADNADNVVDAETVVGEPLHQLLNSDVQINPQPVNVPLAVDGSQRL
jgi:hypothetical protein